ncbi:MAG: hypothetical protein IPJ17_07485 [Holophagales bacterium]|nr:MAG: hypothetical protein IPJ17_07485 [Holophagales bacterium]
MQPSLRPRRLVRTLFVLLGVTLLAARPGSAQLQWKSQDEKSTFKVGILGQLQGESLDVANASGKKVDTSKNLFLRRARILMNFTFGDKLSIFAETDSPNLGKSNTAGVKDANDMYLQDFVVGYKFKPTFQIEAGMLLPAISYNHNQSAASLLAADYGAYTFTESTPIGGRVGRDYGIQARGYAAENHLEYRVGILQGSRGTNAANGMRTYGRVMYSFFTPQTGLFYRGTSLGKTKTVAIGASYDGQEDYSSIAADFFADLPLPGGNGLTIQADLMKFDGDKFLTAIPKQNDKLVEIGFFAAKAKIMPYVQFAQRDFDAVSRIDEKRYSFGIGFFPAGHNHNVKIAYTKISPSKGDDLAQVVVQWQVFQF